MHKILFALSVLISSLFPDVLLASTTLTTQEIVARVLENNLPLRQFASDANMAVLEQKGENALGNTEIEVGHEWGNNFAGNKFNVSLTQEFDWPGIYHARSKAISSLERLNSVEFLLKRENLELEVRQLLIDIAAQKQINELLRKVSTGFDSMLMAAEKKRETQSITLLDLNKIRIEAASAKVEYAEGVSCYGELSRQLAEMLSVPSIDFDVSADFDFENLSTFEVYQTALSNSTQMAVESARVDYATAVSKSAAAERAPAFSLGYDFEREDGATFNGFHVGVSFSLFSSRFKAAASKSEVVSAGLAKLSMESQLQSSLRRDYLLAQSLQNQMDSYGPAIAIADNLELVQKAYELGQLTLIDYFQEINYFLDAQMKFVDIQRRYARTVVSLNRYL